MSPTELKNLAQLDQNSETLVRVLLNHKHFFDFHSGIAENINGKSVQTFLAAVIACEMGMENNSESFERSMAMAALLDPNSLADKCRDFIFSQLNAGVEPTLGEI